MPISYNESTNEAFFLDGDKWQPAKVSENPKTKERFAFDGQEWKALPKPSRGVLDYAGDVGLSLAQGATFGYSDELYAKALEATGFGTYDENVKAARERYEQVPTAISLPGEIAGGIATTLAGGAVAAPFVAGTRLVALASKLPAWARFMGLGATEGAIAGSGQAVEGERASGALKGGAVGGVVGGAAPHLIKGAVTAANAVRSQLSPQAGMVADILRAALRDETTPQVLAQKLADAQTLRPGVATLADVGGENVQGLLERVAQTPGAGRTKVIPFLKQRQVEQMDRFAADLSHLTGAKKLAHDAIEETIAARKTAAEPLYKQAFSFQAEGVPDVINAWEREISTGWGKSILSSPALKRNLQTEYGVSNVADAPLMVQIDAWKKTVDDQISAAIKGGQKNTVRILEGMRDRVLSVVDVANPDYAAARNAWAGPSKFLDAIDYGKSILDKKLTSVEFAQRMAKATDADKEGIRLGAIAAIRAKMGNDPAKLADMTKYLRADEMQAKVASIMPTPDAAESWLRRLEFETTLSELTGRSLGNSATARRLAEKSDADNIVGDLVMDAISGAPTASLWRSIVQAGPRKLRDTWRSRTDAKLADILLEADSQALIPRLQNMPAQRALPGPRASAIGTAGGVMAAENIRD
jgi:hypothetical protein